MAILFYFCFCFGFVFSFVPKTFQLFGISIVPDEGYIQIYPVSEGYLRKMPVERRGKYPEPL